MKEGLCLLCVLGVLASLSACGGSAAAPVRETSVPLELAEPAVTPSDDVEESELGPGAAGLTEEEQIWALGPDGSAEPGVWSTGDASEDMGDGEMKDAEFDGELVSETLAEDHVIVWNDAALEAGVRSILEIPSGDVMLSDLWETLELDLSGLGIRDISALAEMTNLLYLDLSDNEITDLSPLEGLPCLSVLNFSGNAVTDLSPLESLPWLTELYLAGNGVTDVSSLSALPYVSWMDLSDNKITDLSPLSAMEELVELDLSGNPVADVTPLSSLGYLSTLDLSDTAVTDVSPLAALEMLDTVNLSGTGLTESGVAVLRDGNGDIDIILD